METKFRLILTLSISFIALLIFNLYQVSSLSIDNFQAQNPEKVLNMLNKEGSIWISLVTFIAMFLGIVFGALYDQISNKSFIKSYKKELVTVFRSTRFLRGMLASPILFIGIYVASNSSPDLAVSLVFAFQNGFFCDAILKKKNVQTI